MSKQVSFGAPQLCNHSRNNNSRNRDDFFTLARWFRPKAMAEGPHLLKAKKCCAQTIATLLGIPGVKTNLWFQTIVHSQRFHQWPAKNLTAPGAKPVLEKDCEKPRLEAEPRPTAVASQLPDRIPAIALIRALLAGIWQLLGGLHVARSYHHQLGTGTLASISNQWWANQQGFVKLRLTCGINNVSSLMLMTSSQRALLTYLSVRSHFRGI